MPRCSELMSRQWQHLFVGNPLISLVTASYQAQTVPCTMQGMSAEQALAALFNDEDEGGDGEEGSGIVQAGKKKPVRRGGGGGRRGGGRGRLEGAVGGAKGGDGEKDLGIVQAGKKKPVGRGGEGEGCGGGRGGADGPQKEGVGPLAVVRVVEGVRGGWLVKPCLGLCSKALHPAFPRVRLEHVCCSSSLAATSLCVCALSPSIIGGII